MGFNMLECVFVVETYTKTETFKAMHDYFCLQFECRNILTKLVMWKLTKKFKKTENVNFQKLGCRVVVLTEESLAEVSVKLEACLRKSLLQLAQQIGMSCGTLQETVKNYVSLPLPDRLWDPPNPIQWVPGTLSRG
jgi:hypothetical protein